MSYSRSHDSSSEAGLPTQKGISCILITVPITIVHLFQRCSYFPSMQPLFSFIESFHCPSLAFTNPYQFMSQIIQKFLKCL